MGNRHEIIVKLWSRWDALCVVCETDTAGADNEYTSSIGRHAQSAVSFSKCPQRPTTMRDMPYVSTTAW